VRDLVAHRWLFLHQIDPSGGGVLQRCAAGWHRIDRA
jgi:hypothetical protein